MQSRCANGWAPRSRTSSGTRLARPRDHPPAGGEVRHRLRIFAMATARGDEGQPHGASCRGLPRGGGAPRSMGDQVVLLDKAGVQAHLRPELLRRAEEHPQHAPAPAQPVHRRGQGGGRPGALIFEHSGGAGYRPRPAAGGDTREGRIEAQQILLAGDVYHKLEAQAAQGMIFPAMGGICYHPAAGRAGTGRSTRRGWRSTIAASSSITTPHRRRPPAARWRRRPSAATAGHRRRAAAMHRAHLPAPEGRGDRVPVGVAPGHVMNRSPSSASSPTTSGTARATRACVATSHIMGEIMAKAMSGSPEHPTPSSVGTSG